MDIKTIDNDWVFENNNLLIVEGKDFVAQNLGQRLRTLLGECELDTELGVPYIEDIFGKRRQQSVIENILKDVILTTPGVISLDRFDLSFDESTRALTADFSVTSDDGDIIINEEVLIS